MQGIVATRSVVAPTGRRWSAVSVLWIAGALACSREPASTPDAEAREEPASIADCALFDESAREAPLHLADLADPVARLVLTGGCPTTFDAVMKKLDEVDAEGCDGDMFEAHRTTMISEIAQLRGVTTGDVEDCTGSPAAPFRGVIQRGCGGRQPWELFFSVAPLATVIDELPEDLEAIGWDPGRQELAFYTLEEGTWRFFGHSRDMLRGPSGSGERRCAACHVAGGLVMKELAPPWLHWEGRVTTPGIDAILTAHPPLGSRTAGKVIDFRPAGKELEDAIRAGNAAWIRSRVEHLRTRGTTRELLRPLFCTVELNLAAASDTATSPVATGGEDGALELPAELFFDPRIGVTARLPLSRADYLAAIVAAGQRMEHSCGARLVDGEGRSVIDTPFDLAFPHRAAIDVQHVDELVRTGVVDEDTALAVLGVDATRPIFSDLRCALLERVPEVPPADRDAARIRAALQATTHGAPAGDRGAAELAANLHDPAAVKARAAAFFAACARRPGRDLAHDVVRWTSRLRDQAREELVLEFRESLPVDDLAVPAGTRFDLATCTLTDA